MVSEDARGGSYDGLASQGESLVANQNKFKRYATLSTSPATDLILVPFAAEIKVVTRWLSPLETNRYSHSG